MRFNMVVKTLFFFSLSLFLMLAGCGGGGGGSKGSVPVTGESYSGKTTQAKITRNNARPILEDAFDGGVSGTGFASVFGAIEANGVDTKRPLVYRYLPKTAKGIARIVAEHSSSQIPAAISALQTETINEVGECGGRIIGSLQIDDVTGNTTGSLTFSSYCLMGIVSNGTVDITGSADPDNGNFNITMNFKNFTEVSKEEGLNFTMNGSLTMVSSRSSETLTMNIYMRDNISSDNYWMEDFILKTSGDDEEDIIEVSGKFYSPEYGYVTLTTVTPFRTWYDDEYPSVGVLIATGSGNSKAKLTALSPTTYKVQADENGDGVYEWDSGVLSWDE